MEVRALTNLKDFLTTGKGKDLVIEFKQVSTGLNGLADKVKQKL